MSASQSCFYQRGSLATVMSPDNAIRLISAAGIPIYQRGYSDKSYFLGSDRSQSILAAKKGNETIALTYDAYGSTRPNSLPVVIGFNGERLDPYDCYLLGNGERSYSPNLRRFRSPDRMSIFVPGNLNSYAYTAGDPINFTDPSGNLPNPIQWFRKFLARRELTAASKNLQYWQTQKNFYSFKSSTPSKTLKNEITSLSTKINKEKLALGIIDSKMSNADSTIIIVNTQSGPQFQHLDRTYSQLKGERQIQQLKVDSLSDEHQRMSNLFEADTRAKEGLRHSTAQLANAKIRLQNLNKKYSTLLVKEFREAR